MRAASDHVKSTIKCCPDGHPVVWTFEFPGYEYVCVECGWKGGVLAPYSLPATKERQMEAAQAVGRYQRERAERTGRPVPEPEPAAEPPTCQGCGDVATGPLDGNKPAHWYSRTVDGVTEFACSRECIKGGMVMPW